MSKVVALEIAANAIRAAEVSGYKTKKPKLLRTGELRLQEGIAGESQVIESEALSDALKSLWLQSKFTTRSVGLLVSGRRFIVRPHTTGQSSMEVLRKILPYEAPNAFPDQVSDLLFDFYPTHTVSTKAGTKTDGLVISSPSEPISELAFALNRAKLDLEFVDFTPLAVTRWIRNNRSEQNYALVNIREESTDIVVVDAGMPRTVRVLSKGLNSKRRRLGLTGIDHSPLLRRDVLGENGVKVLVQDIGLTVTTQSEEISGELECIFTSGPRAEDPELRASISEQFGIPVIPLYIDSIPQDEDEELNRKPSFDDFVAMTGGMR
jgi:Tfp pilus assembly PilM family ATPase